MILYFCRHASAGARRPRAREDERRPLDAAGMEQCRLMGRALSALGASVEEILASPLKRATQTAALLGNEMGHEGRIGIEASLRPEAAYAEFLQMLELRAHQEALLLVGHKPSLPAFLGRLLAPEGHRAAIELKKGAVAKVEMNGRRAALKWLLPPKAVQVLCPPPPGRRRG